MSTLSGFSPEMIKGSNRRWSEMKSIIETSFYGNNVTTVSDLTQAYNLAKEIPGTIVTDHEVHRGTELGLPSDAKVLVYNDGQVVGRTATARRIMGQPNVDEKEYAAILREAIFSGSRKAFYAGEVVVGLSPELMIRSHLMVPTDYANTLYSYLLNFQLLTKELAETYHASNPLAENDIYIYGDPDWQHLDFPNGLALFDPERNVAAILGLRYFGEFKKATLTLAWATAKRHNFVPCHGGLKQFSLPTKKYTMAAFGLSGSGKSTITLAEHEGRYPIKVLHDDAFVVNQETGATTALEPAYFDKTEDYPLTHEAIKYFLTCQNVGVTLNEQQEKVLVTDDIRNGNGRTVKSRFVTPHRVDHLADPLDAIFWIMKDDSLPPVLKLEQSDLAAVFGATLATKRSSAENVIAVEDELVIEPYANPFRAYPLGEDYRSFRKLFAENSTACYILNTSYFNGKKITPEETLTSIEKIVNGTADFEDFGSLKGFKYLPLVAHPVDFYEPAYLAKLHERMKTRLNFVTAQRESLGGYNRLPDEATDLLHGVVKELAQALVREEIKV